ncbi:hypothetical protein C7C45_15140 [Micromonospora arborensis]|uniref:PPE family domain-containing protein n=1 Tax=Micromonospora arborensis TaxID=2116518 RepID=A0A318NMV7_9ACTN|nr:hypothetical protein [Micromonospora arborensis]PYC70037.1 hypothetical protein C7C45_15140 [Micromonospora arborensis]
MDVNSMWACLQDHDTTNHWKQVAGWRKVCDLAQTHLGRLQEYRRGLAEAWPPETSAASRTYLAELDELIDKVQRTHNAAAANYTALSAATQAIGTTRAALRNIHEEYATKFQQKQAYESMAADPKAVMGNRVTEAPVTDAELERLNVQARAAMFNLSSELQQAQATLQKPPPPPSRPRRDSSSSDTYSTSAPAIPPILPMPITVSRVPHLPLPSALGSPQPAQVTPVIGPILGGTSSGVASPSTSAGISGTGVSVPPPGAGPAPLLPSPIARAATPPANGTLGATNRPTSGNINRVSQTQPPTMRPMPPGGLIGGTPSLGLGQPGSASSPTRRVNPIGGVIGGGGAGTTPTGGAGSRPGGGRGSAGGQHLPPMGGAPGFGGTAASGSAASYPPGRPTGKGQHDDGRAWDPDSPWEVDQGVDPIVRPPEEQGPPDPGPAIGFNR